MIKKIFLILMAIVVVLPSYPIDLSSVKAATPGAGFTLDKYAPPGTTPHTIILNEQGNPRWVASNGYLLDAGTGSHTLGPIKIHDYLNESPAHNYTAGQPKGNIEARFNEIADMIETPGSRSDRNGWSGYHMVCGPDRTWTEYGRHSTDYSDPSRSYVPTEDEWDMYVEERTANYMTDEAKDRLDATIEYAKLHSIAGHPSGSWNVQLTEYNQIIYKSPDGGEYYAYTSQTADCDPGAEHVYYNDLDFFISMTFSIPADPVTPGCPEGQKCCDDPVWVAQNPTADCGSSGCTGSDCCPQTDPLCHPPTKTGCPNNPPPGESCTPDTDKSGDKTTFETKPRTYAELKDGTVYNEKWDAMAGVPNRR